MLTICPSKQASIPSCPQANLRHPFPRQPPPGCIRLWIVFPKKVPTFRGNYPGRFGPCPLHPSQDGRQSRPSPHPAIHVASHSADSRDHMWCEVGAGHLDTLHHVHQEQLKTGCSVCAPSGACLIAPIE